MLIALFAPWLAPHDPNWQDRRRGYKHRVVSTGSALTVTGRPTFTFNLRQPSGTGAGGIVTIITLPVGLLIGILAGYYGAGWNAC